jgi:hypothetical protein
LSSGIQRQFVADSLVRAALLLVLVIAAGAEAAARGRDSTEVARRVVIGDQGVQIVGDDSNRAHVLVGSDQVDIKAGRSRVRIGPAGVEVSSPGHPVEMIGPAIEVGGGDNDVVRVFEDAEVPPGKRVDGDVVAVCGSVTVHGQVTGSAVAVLGTVTMDSTARVDGDVVAVGGTVDALPGSSIGGQSVSVGFMPIAHGMPATTFVLGSLLLGWLLASLFLGWLLQLLFADRMTRAAVTAARRTGVSFLLGLVSAPLMVIACVLLLITVVGIPFALLLPIAYCLLTWAGQLAGSYVLGCKLLRRNPAERWSYAPLALGTLFIAAFFTVSWAIASRGGFMPTAALFFGLVGSLILVGLTVIGTGAILVSRLGAQPADPFAHAQAAAGSRPAGPGGSAGEGAAPASAPPPAPASV